VYFVSAAAPSQRVQVTGHLADNTPGRIVEMIPALAAGQRHVEAVTQFASRGTAAKEPRTARLAAALTV
jgi:hypothetical protein